MTRVLYFDGQYKIIECGRESFVLINTKGTYDNHAHFNRIDVCHCLIKMIRSKRVPNNKRLRTSAKRVSIDADYLSMIDAHVNNPKARYIIPSQKPRR